MAGSRTQSLRLRCAYAQRGAPRRCAGCCALGRQKRTKAHKSARITIRHDGCAALCDAVRRRRPRPTRAGDPETSPVSRGRMGAAGPWPRQAGGEEPLGARLVKGTGPGPVWAHGTRPRAFPSTTPLPAPSFHSKCGLRDTIFGLL